MNFGRKSSVLVALALTAALLLTAIGTRSIFAGASATAVSLVLPSGFSNPEGMELLSAGEKHYLLCGTEDEQSFVLLLDENGQVVDQSTVSAHMAYPLYRKGNLSLVCPYRGGTKEELSWIQSSLLIFPRFTWRDATISMWIPPGGTTRPIPRWRKRSFCSSIRAGF